VRYFYIYEEGARKHENLMRNPGSQDVFVLNPGSNESSGVKSSFCFGDVDVVALNGTFQQRVGFLLWIKDGYLESLEAYTYGDGKWPEKYDNFQINYIGNERNIKELRRNWEL
jgi:hypothetical protein